MDCRYLDLVYKNSKVLNRIKTVKKEYRLNKLFFLAQYAVSEGVHGGNVKPYIKNVYYNIYVHLVLH